MKVSRRGLFGKGIAAGIAALSAKLIPGGEVAQAVGGFTPRYEVTVISATPSIPLASFTPYEAWGEPSLPSPVAHITPNMIETYALSTDPGQIDLTPDNYQMGGYEAAIHEACAQYGCDPYYLIAVVDCETGGTWDHWNSVGPNGERGLFQFHPQGEWPYAAWYGPYEQIDLAAQLFAAGRADAWVCPI